jgi:polyisoprenoid-binding protein YceI
MRRYLTIVILLLLALLTYGCANPAANKPKATVRNVGPADPTKPAGGEVLSISPENSKVEFVAAKVTRSHNGSFKQFAGTINLVNSAVEVSRVTIEIEAASVVTDEDALTKHLQTPDFFDVAKYPKATFTSTRIEPSNTGGATHNVTGNFELHGITKSITFPAIIQVVPDSVSVDADFAINRKDFGLLFPGKADDLIRDGVVIKLTVKVPRAKP